MADTDDESEETLTKQVLNMILENHALRDSVFPYLTGYLVFNVIILVLLIYISVRISLK
jgi:hypothetical protein